MKPDSIVAITELDEPGHSVDHGLGAINTAGEGGSDADPGKTRKEWRLLGRYPAAGAVGDKVTDPVTGAIRQLLRYDQTVDEATWQQQQLERARSDAQRWQREWSLLMTRLGRWQQEIDGMEGPAAEFQLTTLVQQRASRVDHWRQIAPRLARFGLELPEPELEPWLHAVRFYREYRLARLVRDEAPDDAELARQVDASLTAPERQHEDPLYLTPYWEYYGRFVKTLEQFRFERNLSHATRIHEFHQLFPARKLRRHVTLYIGPTNSGKTWHALQRLAKSPSGVYLAPLRLLALEVSETLQGWGVPCDMVTGEERILRPGSTHVASTIEMLSYTAEYDLCVIDEAQMIGDRERGWAWTQAILGVHARDVCVIGSPECRTIVEKLLNLTGDFYDVVELDRLTPLTVMSQPVRHIEELEPGTAIVAFSRVAVLGLKKEIERHTGKRVAVLYGALPPEVRREQARLFSSGEAPFLAATDAIGMGLNLPIQTLLFAQDRKIIDREEHPLTPLEVRQIAGRAGRFGINEHGWVGTFNLPLERIRTALQRRPPPIRRAHLAPTLDQLRAIAGIQEGGRIRLAKLLSLFQQAVKPDPRVYDLANLDDQIVLARITDRFDKLDLSTRFALASAPVPIRSFPAMAAFEWMTATVAAGESLTPEDLLGVAGKYATQHLERLETSMKIINLYCWLHYRFSDHFPELTGAEQRRSDINGEINRILAAVQPPVRLCAECQAPLPADKTYDTCFTCWQKRAPARPGRHRGGGGRGGRGGTAPQRQQRGQRTRSTP
jgi:ATP-dependent RNA helicase SUPV3L1/SUV3